MRNEAKYSYCEWTFGQKPRDIAKRLLSWESRDNHTMVICFSKEKVIVLRVSW